MNPRELHAHLLDVLDSAPATRDLPDVEGLADALLRLLRGIVATELTMIADDAEARGYCLILNGRTHDVVTADNLRARARNLTRGGAS